LFDVVKGNVFFHYYQGEEEAGLLLGVSHLVI